MGEAASLRSPSEEWGWAVRFLEPWPVGASASQRGPAPDGVQEHFLLFLTFSEASLVAMAPDGGLRLLGSAALPQGEEGAIIEPFDRAALVGWLPELGLAAVATQGGGMFHVLQPWVTDDGRGGLRTVVSRDLGGVCTGMVARCAPIGGEQVCELAVTLLPFPAVVPSVQRLRLQRAAVA